MGAIHTLLEEMVSRSLCKYSPEECGLFDDNLAVLGHVRETHVSGRLSCVRALERLRFPLHLYLDYMKLLQTYFV